MNKPKPLLSIAIPSYNRPQELKYALDRFAEQILGEFEDQIEIIVTDDLSTDETPDIARQFAKTYDFVRLQSNPQNIGLEQNLINCGKDCKGKYIWIFGDDDFLEFDDSLSEIMSHLRKGEYSFYVLNRTRRNKHLTKLISDDWMGVQHQSNVSYDTLKDFLIDRGLISVIGFISVNIFEREKFISVSPEKYWGTMYPQLGMMVQAFCDQPTLLLTRPLICHRTETMEEKRAALGHKKAEKAFMSDVRERDATYFSLPFVGMVNEFVRLGCLTPEDVVKIPENTVIKGHLIDFLINTMQLAQDLDIPSQDSQWKQARAFFEDLPLSWVQRSKLRKVWRKIDGFDDSYTTQLTFSAITPSFNQAEFLSECLQSIQEQSVKPFEHFVFDPGSNDNSREIAENFPGVTLVAEKDKGQSDALNKGFQRVSGDIIVWLNSDDCLFDDGVFERVARRFEEPDSPDIIYGKGIFIRADGTHLRDVYINKNPDTLPWRFQQEDGILQPALFMRRQVVEKVGLLTLHRHYCMDYEYWIRCIKHKLKFVYMDEHLALARYHSSNKTLGERDKSYFDVCDMLMEQFGYVNHVWLRRYAEYLSEGFDGVLTHAHNQAVSRPDELERHYEKLLRDYNGRDDVLGLLQSKSSEKGYGDTLREMNRLGIVQSAPGKAVSEVSGKSFEFHRDGVARDGQTGLEEKMTIPKKGSQVSFQGKRFYAEFGDKLKRRSPRLFVLLQMIRRTSGGLWRRRAWVAPVILLIMAMIGLGWLPTFGEYRFAIWAAALVVIFGFSNFYLGWRLYNSRNSLLLELNELRQEVLRLKRTNKKLQGEQRRHLEQRIDKNQASLLSLDKSLLSLDEKHQTLSTQLSHLAERLAAGEKQIGSLRYESQPRNFIFFGHHKCGSRFFRELVFSHLAEVLDANVRQYKIDNPPFHYSRGEDLDLCNMNFSGLGAEKQEIVLFSNAGLRSLEEIHKSTDDWKGLRVLRDPRQVLVSNYFHHKGDHNTELNGWVYDKLVTDQPILRSLPEEEGLLYELDNISKDIIENQLLVPFDDERILTIKLEDFSTRPQQMLRQLSEFFNVADISGIDLSKTFSNASSGEWQKHFTSRLRDEFKKRYGQQLIDLGYAENLDW